MSESRNVQTIVPVSVVIPYYRHAETIGRAVASVARQSVRPLELIVVNDGGGEDVGNVLKNLQDRYGVDWFSIVTLLRNVGAGEARNAGWAVARGAYVAFLDADDAWHPCKIEVQYGYMAMHPEVSVCGHRHRREASDARWDEYRLTEHCFKVTFVRLLFSNQFITPSAMVRGNLDVRFAAKQRHMEDFRLWLTVAIRGGHIVRLEDELACIFKPSFGESGLSAELVRMEMGELQTYWAICREKCLLFPAILLLVPYSLAKFLRRLFLRLSCFG